MQETLGSLAFTNPASSNLASYNYSKNIKTNTMHGSYQQRERGSPLYKLSHFNMFSSRHGVMMGGAELIHRHYHLENKL